MALIECKNCNNTISDKASKCPHCGYDRREEKNKLTLGVSLSCIGLVFLLLYMIFLFIYN